MFTPLFCFASFLLRALRCFVVVKEFFALYLNWKWQRETLRCTSAKLGSWHFQPTPTLRAEASLLPIAHGMQIAELQHV
jgi:hypothetical protein